MKVQQKGWGTGKRVKKCSITEGQFCRGRMNGAVNAVF